MECLISIVVPVYNAEIYLKECIDSLLGQKEKECYEIILVNDGSTDNSLNICKKYLINNNIIRIISGDNAGVSITRNKGIEAARGKYITFVDSDDYVSKDYIEKVIEIIKNDADMYIFNNYTVNEDGIIKIRKEWDKDDKQLTMEEGYKKLLSLELSAPWNKIFKREIILKNNIRFKKDLYLGEDLIFCLQYLEKCERVFLSKQALYYYRYNSKSLYNSKMNIQKLDQLCKQFNYVIFILSDFPYYYINFFKNSMIKVCTSFIAKLKKNRIESEQIIKKLNEYNMYNSLINEKYSGLNHLRKFLLQHKYFNIIRLIFAP